MIKRRCPRCEEKHMVWNKEEHMHYCQNCWYEIPKYPDIPRRDSRKRTHLRDWHKLKRKILAMGDPSCKVCLRNGGMTRVD